jgi:hypothetical protein
MRSLRFGFLALLFALNTGVVRTVHAEEPPAGASHGENHGEGEENNSTWQGRQDNTDVFAKGGEYHQHERPVYDGGGKWTPSGGWKTDPVVGTNSAGRPYDKSNGRFVSNDDAHWVNHERGERLEGWNEGQYPRGVTVLSQNGHGAVGVDVGPFKNGTVNLVKGEYGSINVDVLRADGQYNAGVGITDRGVTGSVYARGVVTLVGLRGETENLALGDPNGLTNASVFGEGRAFVGADAQVNGNLSVGKDGILAQGGASAFAGAKAEGQVSGQVTICGVQIAGTGLGEVSAGAGAEATGVFKVDWSTMTVRMGAKVGAALGLGAGVGGTVEISIDKLVRNFPQAAQCILGPLNDLKNLAVDAGKTLVNGAVDLGKGAVNKLSDGYDSVKNGLGNAASFVGDHLPCLWGCHDDKPKAVATNGGYNGSRNDSTVPPPIPQTTVPGVNGTGMDTPIYGQKR